MKKSIYKKTIIMIIILQIIVLALVGCESKDTTEIVNSFEIYLATSESTKEFGYYDYENLKLNETPILTQDDIRTYYWENHIIELNSAYIEMNSERTSQTSYLYKLKDGYREYTFGGSKLLASLQFDAFVVVINGEAIYSGTFPYSPALSYSTEEFIIADISDSKIQLIFSGENFDVRNEDVIYDFFLKENKLEVNNISILNEDITHLEEEVARLNEEKNELLNQLDEQINESDLVKNLNQEYFVKSNWLENRVIWYMYGNNEYEFLHDYSEYLNNLDDLSVESINLAIEYFNTQVTDDKYNNDIIFNVFEEYYYAVIDNMKRYLKENDITDEYIEIAKINGIDIKEQNSVIYVAPAYEFLQDNFAEYVTIQTNKYLQALDFEKKIFNDADSFSLYEESEIKISLTDFEEIIITWEEYSYEYGYYGNNFPFFYKGREKLQEYFDIYTGKIQIQKSRIFDENGFLTEKYLDSYISMIGSYINTETGQLVLELYTTLKNNEYANSIEYTEFINKVKYDILY